MECITCGRLLDEHYLVNGKYKCALPQGSDISYLSEYEQAYHRHFWQWIRRNKMKVRKFAIVVTDNEGNEVGRKDLTAQWGPELGEKLEELHHINAEDEIARMLAFEIRQCITTDFVRELL